MAQPATTRSLGRLSEIAQVMVRHGFGYWLQAHKLTDLLPGRSAEARLAAASESGASARGQHLREVFEELGPTFVKFGQLLSTRPDVVPPDIIAELRPLQDDVRPFPFAEAERVIEEELGNTIARLFLDFDEEPVAAASIGQVHRATLPNGKAVAVKVQRPGAQRQIESDVQLMYQAARLVKERVRSLDFIDARGLVDEFARQLRTELDYRLEGRNAQTFHRNFAGDQQRARPEGVLAVLARTRADARVDRGHAAQGRRHAAALARGASRPRVSRRRDVDDDDLPPRLRPRRPAPGEHPRPRGGGDDRPRRLRRRREAHRRRHDEADAAVHRRGGGERRDAAEAARRSRRRVPEGAGGGVPSPSCARSTTATTARASRRSTRSRSSARRSSSSTR